MMKLNKKLIAVPAIAITAEGTADIQRALDTLGSSMSAGGSNENLGELLQHVAISAQSGAGVSVFGGEIDQ